MAEFYIDGDKCKSFEIAIKKAAQQIKEFNTFSFIDFRFQNGENHPLVARNIGNRIECDRTAAARIFDELLTEALTQK